MNNLHSRFVEDLRQRTGSKFNSALAMELLEIAKKVHIIDVGFCNVDFTDKQRARYELKRDSLIEYANFIARELGAISIYHQSDPRGWPLRLIFKGDIPDGESVEAYYDRGLAVPPRR